MWVQIGCIESITPLFRLVPTLPRMWNCGWLIGGGARHRVDFSLHRLHLLSDPFQLRRQGLDLPTDQHLFLVLVHLLVDPGNLGLSTPIMMTLQVICKTSRTYLPFYTIASHFTMIAGILSFSSLVYTLETAT
jgi:hypothetical protein